MKFFTPERIDEIVDPWTFKELQCEYLRYLHSLGNKIPDHIYSLVELEAVQDGLIVRARRISKGNILELTIRCGHLQMGYYNLTLRYLDAEISPDDDINLARIARGTYTSTRHYCDFAHHEIDLCDDGRIEHRVMFFTRPSCLTGDDGYLCFTIRCRDIKWKRDGKASRRLPPFKERYPGGPSTDHLMPISVQNG